MLGSVLKGLRAKRGITQEELGKRIGVTTSMVGMYETNVRKPSFDVLIKIAEYFDCTTDFLLGRTDNPHEHSLSGKINATSKVTGNMNISSNQQNAASGLEDWTKVIENAINSGLTPDQLNELVNIHVKMAKKFSRKH